MGGQCRGRGRQLRWGSRIRTWRVCDGSGDDLGLGHSLAYDAARMFLTKKKMWPCFKCFLHAVNKNIPNLISAFLLLSFHVCFCHLISIYFHTPEEIKCKILRCWCSIRYKYGILNCSWLDIIAFSCLSKRFKSTPKALPSLWWMGTIFLQSNKKKKRAFSTVPRNEHTVSWKYSQGDGSTKRWNQKGRLSKVSQNADRKKRKRSQPV